MATYMTTSFQLAWAFPDPTTGFAGALVKFAAIFAVTQIPLALTEGLLSVLVMNLLRGNALEAMRESGVPAGEVIS
jgi:cobalt/nickel transport system permease protein